MWKHHRHIGNREIQVAKSVLWRRSLRVAFGSVVLFSLLLASCSSTGRVPPKYFFPSAVSCATPLRCVVVGSSVEEYGGARTTSNGGKSFTRSVVPSQFPSNSVSCPTEVRCFSVGSSSSKGAVSKSNDGGRSWTPHIHLTGLSPFAVISCATALSCMVTSTAARVVVTNDGGKHWTDKALPSEAGNLMETLSLFSISCPGVQMCVVVGATVTGESVVYVTRDGGQTWSSQTFTDTQLLDVSCANQVHCVLVGRPYSIQLPGQSPLIYDSFNGAKTWASVTTPEWSRRYFPLSASCVDSSCVAPAAVGRVILYSHDYGVHWQVATPPGTFRPGAVSCGSASRCVITAFSHGTPSPPMEIWTSDGGKHWSLTSTT